MTAPEPFARLIELTSGEPGKPLIVHVQDAHANLSAQEQIASLLDALFSTHGPIPVLVEGGTQDDSLTFLKSAASPEAWKKAARKFLLEGKISGEEYLSLTTEHPVRILGIEDAAAYRRGLEAYASLARRRQEGLDRTRRLLAVTAVLKRSLYPQDLLSADTACADPSALQACADFLLQAGYLERSEAVEGWLSALRQEKQVDFDVARLETASLLELIGSLSKQPQGRPRGGSASSGDVQSQLSFVRQLEEAAESRGQSLDRYPALTRYRDYLESARQVPWERLIEEVERAFERSFEARGGDALRLRQAERLLRLFEKAYEIRLSSGEYRQLRERSADFSETAIEAFLNRKLADRGSLRDLVPASGVLDRSRALIDAFYRSAAERDEAFVRNSEKWLASEKAPAAVLIAGGYHTNNLARMFRQRGWSYAVFRPKVDAQTVQEKYERLLLGPIGENGAAMSEDGRLPKQDAIAIAKIAEPMASDRRAELVAVAQSFEGARAVEEPDGARLSRTEDPQDPEETVEELWRGLDGLIRYYRSRFEWTLDDWVWSLRYGRRPWQAFDPNAYSDWVSRFERTLRTQDPDRVSRESLALLRDIGRQFSVHGSWRGVEDLRGRYVGYARHALFEAKPAHVLQALALYLLEQSADMSDQQAAELFNGEKGQALARSVEVFNRLGRPRIPYSEASAYTRALTPFFRDQRRFLRLSKALHRLPERLRVPAVSLRIFLNSAHLSVASQDAADDVEVLVDDLFYAGEALASGRLSEFETAELRTALGRFAAFGVPFAAGRSSFEVIWDHRRYLEVELLNWVRAHLDLFAELLEHWPAYSESGDVLTRDPYLAGLKIGFFEDAAERPRTKASDQSPRPAERLFLGPDTPERRAFLPAFLRSVPRSVLNASQGYSGAEARRKRVELQSAIRHLRAPETGARLAAPKSPLAARRRESLMDILRDAKRPLTVAELIREARLRKIPGAEELTEPKLRSDLLALQQLSVDLPNLNLKRKPRMAGAVRGPSQEEEAHDLATSIANAIGYLDELLGIKHSVPAEFSDALEGRGDEADPKGPKSGARLAQAKEPAAKAVSIIVGLPAMGAGALLGAYAAYWLSRWAVAGIRKWMDDNRAVDAVLSEHFEGLSRLPADNAPMWARLDQSVRTLEHWKEVLRTSHDQSLAEKVLKEVLHEIHHRSLLDSSWALSPQEALSLARYWSRDAAASLRSARQKHAGAGGARLAVDDTARAKTLHQIEEAFARLMAARPRRVISIQSLAHEAGLHPVTVWAHAGRGWLFQKIGSQYRSRQAARLLDALDAWGAKPLGPEFYERARVSPAEVRRYQKNPRSEVGRALASLPQAAVVESGQSQTPPNVDRGLPGVMADKLHQLNNWGSQEFRRWVGAVLAVEWKVGGVEVELPSDFRFVFELSDPREPDEFFRQVEQTFPFLSASFDYTSVPRRHEARNRYQLLGLHWQAYRRQIQGISDLLKQRSGARLARRWDASDVTIEKSLASNSRFQVYSGSLEGRPVVLKKPQAGLPADDRQAIVKRMQREMEVYQALSQVSGFDALSLFPGFVGGRTDTQVEEPFLILEHVSGYVTLRERLKTGQWSAVSPDEALAITGDVLRALSVLHDSTKYIHRDLKPENILIAKDRPGPAKLFDFELAVPQGSSEVRRPGRNGTRQYWAPEQIRMTPIDERVDIFAAGLILYELLSGFDVRKRDYLSHEDLLTRVRLADFPEPLEAILLSSLAESPDRRPEDADDMMRALEAWMGSTEYVRWKDRPASVVSRAKTFLFDFSRAATRPWRDAPSKRPDLGARLALQVDLKALRLGYFSDLKNSSLGLMESFSGIRGKFGQDGLSEEAKVVAAAFAYSHARLLFQKWRRADPEKRTFRLVIGGDSRPTGEEILAWQMAGWKLAASEVPDIEVRIVDIGVTTTPLIESAVRSLRADGGVMITASHNPLDQNGFKFLTGLTEPEKDSLNDLGALLNPTKMDGVIRRTHGLFHRLAEGRVDFVRRLNRLAADVSGAHTHTRHLSREYVERHYVEFMAESVFGLSPASLEKRARKHRQYRAVIDSNGGSGAVGTPLRAVQAFGFEAHELNGVLGQPTRGIEPIGEALVQIGAQIVHQNADAGVAGDHDFDRGQLVAHDRRGHVILFSPQETSYLSVANMVAWVRAHPEFYPKARGRKMAVVVHDATSERLSHLMDWMGVETFETETGEVNVVTRMRELDRAGYFVVAGVEGYNGGVILHGSQVRDGTQMLILSMLVLADRKAFNALRKAVGLPKWTGPRYTLADVLGSLPVYFTRQRDNLPYPYEASMEPEIKKGIEKAFRARVTSLGSGRYRIAGMGDEVFRFEKGGPVFDSDYSRVRSADRPGRRVGTGGLIIRFLDSEGRRHKIWFRRSKTEYGPFRTMVDAPTEERAQALEQLRDEIYAEATGARLAESRITPVAPGLLEKSNEELLYRHLAQKYALMKGVAADVASSSNRAPAEGLLSGGASTVYRVDLNHNNRRRPAAGVQDIYGDATNLTAVLETASLDAVILNDAIHHIVLDKDRSRTHGARELEARGEGPDSNPFFSVDLFDHTLRQAQAVLKPGGLLVIKTSSDFFYGRGLAQGMKGAQTDRELASLGFEILEVAQSNGTALVVARTPLALGARLAAQSRRDFLKSLTAIVSSFTFFNSSSPVISAPVLSVQIPWQMDLKNRIGTFYSMTDQGLIRTNALRHFIRLFGLDEVQVAHVESRLFDAAIQEADDRMKRDPQKSRDEVLSEVAGEFYEAVYGTESFMDSILFRLPGLDRVDATRIRDAVRQQRFMNGRADNQAPPKDLDPLYSGSEPRGDDADLARWEDDGGAVIDEAGARLAKPVQGSQESALQALRVMFLEGVRNDPIFSLSAREVTDRLGYGSETSARRLLGLLQKEKFLSVLRDSNPLSRGPEERRYHLSLAQRIKLRDSVDTRQIDGARLSTDWSDPQTELNHPHVRALFMGILLDWVPVNEKQKLALLAERGILMVDFARAQLDGQDGYFARFYNEADTQSSQHFFSKQAIEQFKTAAKLAVDGRQSGRTVLAGAERVADKRLAQILAGAPEVPAHAFVGIDLANLRERSANTEQFSALAGYLFERMAHSRRRFIVTGQEALSADERLQIQSLVQRYSSALSSRYFITAPTPDAVVVQVRFATQSTVNQERPTLGEREFVIHAEVSGTEVPYVSGAFEIAAVAAGVFSNHFSPEGRFQSEDPGLLERIERTGLLKALQIFFSAPSAELKASDVVEVTKLLKKDLSPYLIRPIAFVEDLVRALTAKQAVQQSA